VIHLKESIKKAISTSLLKQNIDYFSLMKMEKEEIIEKLSVYHEELRFQNDELNQTNLRLSSSLELYHELFHELPIPIIIIDQSGFILEVNTVGKEFLNLERPTGSFNTIVRWESQDKYYLYLRKIEKEPLKRHIEKLDLEISDVTYHVSVYGNVERGNRNGNIRLVIIDETSRIEIERKILYLSNHDQLTGLYNRRFYEKHIYDIKLKNKKTVGVAYLDLDNLKLINDAFGHKEGDEVLIQFAKTVKNLLDESDVFCRIGGDEFVLFIERVGYRKITTVLSNVEEQIRSITRNELEVTVSMGTAIKVSIDEDIEDTIRYAEENMYQNKIYASKNGKLKIVGSILSALYGKYPTEEEHSQRVSELMTLFASAMGFETSDLVRYRSAGLLHDIGKIGINFNTLQAKRKLTKDEFEEIKRHPEIGYKILISSRTEPLISEAALMHHERIDGKGYPRGVKGDAISQVARMLAICDSFDAMISKREYKPKFTINRSIEELVKCSGTQFDENLVTIFIEKVIPKTVDIYL